MPTNRTARRAARRHREGRLSWWECHALLVPTSMARAYLTAEDLVVLEREHGAYLADLKRAHPEASVWELCSLASGHRGIVSRPRCLADVRGIRVADNGDR